MSLPSVRATRLRQPSPQSATLKSNLDRPLGTKGTEPKGIGTPGTRSRAVDGMLRRLQECPFRISDVWIRLRLQKASLTGSLREHSQETLVTRLQ